jgi:hypothetical protein
VILLDERGDLIAVETMPRSEGLRGRRSKIRRINAER